jgi:DHA1 family multidrug resistance protein-like MFS transporter
MAGADVDSAAAENRRYWRVTLSIAAATGVASLSFNFWWPFMPLYLLDLGATSDADAVFWVALASTTQGITRLVTGPIWGVLSDRFGRKIMLLRALYFATGTTLIATVMTEPWQALLVFGFQGVFSGFVPASVALGNRRRPGPALRLSRRHLRRLPPALDHRNRGALHGARRPRGHDL